MSSTFTEQKKSNRKTSESLLSRYREVRQQSVLICEPLEKEDYVVQPVVDVSPPKWHLGHTTWFFETFILKPQVKSYREFHPEYNFVFNSYYESVGARVIRTDRGNLSRPSVEDVFQYRKHVDEAMEGFLREDVPDSVQSVLELGLHHEQQHQELLYTDIKYILGHNPLFPAYSPEGIEMVNTPRTNDWVHIEEGVYEIGFEGKGFCFDNELRRHKIYLQDGYVSADLVANEEYLEFINDGGYGKFQYWHSDGWEWVKSTGARAPLYWHFVDGDWHYYTLSGLKKIDPQQPVTHISFYEAYAFANWKGVRLPTEAEWEIAAKEFSWGSRWEWTGSAYLPYPGFKTAKGAIGEYNGKFMVNQMVLRGASVATSKNHSRITYRNFFQPQLQWQFTGIRLAR